MKNKKKYCEKCRMDMPYDRREIPGHRDIDGDRVYEYVCQACGTSEEEV